MLPAPGRCRCSQAEDVATVGLVFETYPSSFKFVVPFSFILNCLQFRFVPFSIQGRPAGTGHGRLCTIPEARVEELKEF